MTGITRFGQESSVSFNTLNTLHDFYSAINLKANIVYSKQENLTNFNQFDWLLTGDPMSHNKKEQFNVVETVDGFDRVSLSKNGFKVILSPKIFILRRNNNVSDFVI
jgi:hypothetical protein